MIAVNLAAQGGTDTRELALVHLCTQLYHFNDVCFELFWLTPACKAFGINLISSECVFKQEKPCNCQSANRRTVAVTKNTNKLAICFEDISSNPHICEGRSTHLKETPTSCFTKTLSCSTNNRHFVTVVRVQEMRQAVLLSGSTTFWSHVNLSLSLNSQVFRSLDLLFQTTTR